MSTKKDKSGARIPSDNAFPVVGVGASAGGLGAFKKLLAAIPAGSGMAYVLVQHLDPNHESALPELLQKVTSIPVSEITDEVKVLPDHIYIIPRNKMVEANDGVLQLIPRPEKSSNGRNLPIDLFFTSLAEVHQTHAIGVVLSGSASDGTAGLKAIKDYGGITFAQDEASSEFSGMPQSAVLAGVVDFILPPEEIAAKLVALRQQVILSDEELQNVPKQEEDVYKKILLLLHLRKGTDFTFYKQTTIRRRILRRMVINKSDEPAEYLKYLQQHKEEQDALHQDLLIPVTEFFRDPKVFEAICELVFPAIMARKADADPIRIWVAACSTGQEAYSMAICLMEFLGDRREKAQIFATDISEPAIAKARRGIYSKSEVAGVSPERLKTFFTETGGRYRLNKEVRDICVFAAHNFLKDPPFGKMDFVSCRNVLIYLEPYLQKRALTTFHYALNPKSYLLLGKSETISTVPEHFAAAGKNDKLFTRKDVPGKFMHIASSRNEQNLRDIRAIPKSENMQTDFQKTADEIILSQYTPAGVVINEAMDIVHFRGNTDRYLSQAPGKPTHNLLKMAKGGLAFELRNIIYKARKEGLPMAKEAIQMQVGSSQRAIHIEAIPLPNIVEPHYLILFHETPNVTAEVLAPPAAGSRKTEAERRVAQLEEALAQAREDMRAISEDQEAVNEELQSANEELLSSSEEMQSLNEELETSKEELQSTNEELTVLNQELSNLNELATTARNYAESVVATIHHPLLVMDKNLRVKSANDAFYQAFQVNRQDTEGLLVYDLGNRQWNIPALRTLLEEIIPEKSEFRDYEVAHNFAGIGERVMLLSGLEIKREEVEEHLIMLTIRDITDQRRHELKEKELLTRFQNLVMQAPAAICIFRGPQFIVELANEKMLQFLDRTADEVMNKPVFDAMPDLRGQGFEALLMSVYTTGKGFVTPEASLNLLRNGSPHDVFIKLAYEPYYEDGRISGVMALAVEMTEEVLMRKQIEASEHRYHELIHSSPSLIAILKGEDNVITIANDAIIHMWGKGNDVIGKPFMQALPELAEQDVEKLITGVYETGVPFYANEMPVTIVRYGNPELRYYTFVFQAQRNTRGEIEGVAIIGNEVTPQALFNLELQKSEAEYRQLADTLPAKIINADVSGNVYYLNKAWADYTGLPLAELQNGGWAKAMHPDALEDVTNRWMESVANGTDFEMELQLLEQTGAYKWHLSRAIPIKDDTGKVLKWIGATTEIHTQKQQKQELERAVAARTAELLEATNALLLKNEELQKTNKELESFTYVSSHDLQEPLRKIQTFSALIRGKEHAALSDTGRQSFQRIESAAARMQTLIQDLLAFSHANKTDGAFEKTDLNKIVAEVMADLADSIQAKGATVDTHGLCDANINPVQFRQVIQNLFTNALKFSKAGTPPHITITCETADGAYLAENNAALPPGRLSTGHKYCHISFADNGIGFEAEYTEKMFEVFQRLHTREQYAGTGIGLAIVKKIVEQHNGAVTASGELGRGATFHIYIPAD